jgi:D-arabinose 1-dehydrogenase-like Zn-dependent alcohol dehydrogenase
MKDQSDCFERTWKLKVEVIPVPKLGPARLMKVKACGVCGSDVRYLRGENSGLSLWQGTS